MVYNNMNYTNMRTRTMACTPTPEIENNRLVPGMEKFLTRRRNLLGEPQANLITSVAKPDKFFPFSSTDPIIIFILLLNFSH